MATAAAIAALRPGAATLRAARHAASQKDAVPTPPLEALLRDAVAATVDVWRFQPMGTGSASDAAAAALIADVVGPYGVTPAPPLATAVCALHEKALENVNAWARAMGVPQLLSATRGRGPQHVREKARDLALWYQVKGHAGALPLRPELLAWLF